MITKIKLVNPIVAMALFLSGCGGFAQSQTPLASISPTPSAPVTVTAVSPTKVSTPTPQAAPTSSIPTPIRSQYHIQAKINTALHTLEIQQTIIFANPAAEPLSDIRLLVEANRYPGVFALRSLSTQDGANLSEPVLDDNQLQITLPQPLPVGQAMELVLGYDLSLPSIPAPEQNPRPMMFGYSQHQTNLVDWFPQLPPYQAGKGWLIYPPGYFGEHQVYDVADYQIDLEILDPNPNLVIAASAPPRQEGSTYHFSLEQARNFVLSLSLEYKVYTQTVGNVTIYSYAFPFFVDAGKRALKDTADAVALYSRLFGPYPRSTLSVVQADFYDGMEYDGLYFLSTGFYDQYQGDPKGYLTMIAVHETAHQWWYSLVGDNQAEEPWLDEAFATYCERIFYAKTYPDLLDWWWSYRVNFYQPVGWINQPIYDYDGFISYRNAVYLRGAEFLENLRKELGDDEFYSFLHDYAQRYGHKLVTSQDFFDVLKEHTSTDLSGLISEYFKPAP